MIATRHLFLIDDNGHVMFHKVKRENVITVKTEKYLLKGAFGW